mmetsp:Transcript_34140/g.73896  ORF Transcript_34140/g.73896 Transcript_34140/m.73896 type:complete len:114 (+) Transcript_34140:283-624(+)
MINVLFNNIVALKAWHNYGFDQHVLYNQGFDVKGLGGDTMHMARLSDTGRMKYSLESQAEDLLGQRKDHMKEIFGEARLRKDGTPSALVDLQILDCCQFVCGHWLKGGEWVKP